MGGLVVLEAVLSAPNLPLRGVITSSPFLSEPNLPAVVKWLLRRLATIAPRLSLNPGAPDRHNLARSLRCGGVHR
ncbi:MAG UNVERIFIED_CONTAM: hypothetical protein LVT10_09600 [Anaerolineae bacterium]